MENGKKEAYAYINQYQKQKYDRITILRKSGDKEQLTAIAKEKGYRTLTEFINSCIDERLDSYSTAEHAAQAPEMPVEPVKTEKPKYLPLTPENVATVDLAELPNNFPYQFRIQDKFGEDGLAELLEMARKI